MRAGSMGTERLAIPNKLTGEATHADPPMALPMLGEVTREMDKQPLPWPSLLA